MKQYCIKFGGDSTVGKVSVGVYGKLIPYMDTLLSTRLFSFKNKIVKQKYSSVSSIFKVGTNCGFTELKSKTASIK